jgi:deoxyribonuclease-4
MKYIGAHVSTAGGVQNAVEHAVAIGATGFALFTKNQRQWKAKPLTEENISQFREKLRINGYSERGILPHDSYLINLGSPKKEGLEKSRKAFLDEVHRCEQLGLRYLNFHPGAHLNLVSEQECIRIIADSINWTLEKSNDIILVLETTAGQGTAVGYRFEQLAEIISMVHDQDRIGVCVDTAHIFAAGYDIREEETYQKTIRILDEIVGLEKIKGFHINDSKKPLGSRVDRHASLGEGYIGMKPFKMLLSDERFDQIPFILETPQPEKWPDEIKILKTFAQFGS